MLKGLLKKFGYVHQSEVNSALTEQKALGRGGNGGTAVIHGSGVAIGGQGGMAYARPSDGNNSEVKIEVKCPACDTLRKFKASKIKELEDALNEVPNHANFSGATLAVVDGDVQLVKFTSKTEALGILDRARKGEIVLVF